MIRREALLLMLGTPLAMRLGEDRTPARVGALAAAEWLARPDFMMYDVGDVHAIHYAEICCAYGALRLASATRDGDRDDDGALAFDILQRYNRMVAAKIPNTLNHVDANVAGVWPLRLYQQGLADNSVFERGRAMADAQWRLTTDDGLTRQARYWIDDIWMIGMLQISLYRAWNSSYYLERAVVMARLYLDKLQEPGGLFHHGRAAPFFWGRGNGWVAAGLAEILSDLPQTHRMYPMIVDRYRRMMAALLTHQADDGMWRQLIDHPEAYKETSSTAMFGFAMAVGVRAGILPAAPYGDAVRKAWDALTGYVGEDGKLSQVCVGTGQSNDVAYYLGRPTVTGDLHGQAALLWFASEMARK